MGRTVLLVSSKTPEKHQPAHGRHGAVIVLCDFRHLGILSWHQPHWDGLAGHYSVGRAARLFQVGRHVAVMLVEQKITQLGRLYSRKLLIARKMEEEIRSLIGARLREERERLDFSQDAFAKLGQVSMRAEQDWERGVSAPKADFLAVAATHGVDVLYVLTGQKTPLSADVLSAEEAALLDNYHHADEADRAAARRFLTALSQQRKAG